MCPLNQYKNVKLKVLMFTFKNRFGLWLFLNVFNFLKKYKVGNYSKIEYNADTQEKDYLKLLAKKYHEYIQMENDQELTETTDSNIGFIVPDSLLDDETSHQGCDLITELPLRKLQHSFFGEKLFPGSHNISSISNMSERNKPNYIHLSSTTESELDEPVILLAGDTVSENSDGSRNETDRNVTVVERTIGKINNTEDESFVSTPAQKIGCLQFSGEHTIVPETMDTYDEVAPTPDAFGSVPMVIPNSPDMDDSDEEDDEITFRPAYPTVDAEHQLTMHASLDHSGSKAESQSFHLMLTPSQADVLEISDEDIRTENRTTEKTVATAMSPLKLGLHSVPEASALLPSLHLQRPTLASKEMESVEGSEESMSVFRRVRSGNTTPQKQKMILDDSDEFLPVAGACNLATKTRQGKISEKLTDSASRKTLSSKKSRGQLFDKPGDISDIGECFVIPKNLGSVTESGLLVTDGEKVFARKKMTAVHKHKTYVGQTSHSEMTVSEDPSYQQVDEDLTLSYDYTGDQKSLSGHDQSVNVASIPCQDSVATEKQVVINSGEITKPSQNLNPQSSQNNNSQPSQNRSQVQNKQGNSSCSGNRLDGFDETTKQTIMNRNDISLAAVPEELPVREMSSSEKYSNKVVRSHFETMLSSTHNVSITSIKREKRLDISQEPENSITKDSVPHLEKSKETSGEHNSIAGSVVDGRPGDSTVTARDTSSTSFSKAVVPSTSLRKSTSLDPYTFHESQSQALLDVSKLPLTETSDVIIRHGRKRIVKRMRKICRKRIRPKLRESKSSSTEDTSKSNQNQKPTKPRGKSLRQKQQKAEKTEQPIPKQQQNQQLQPDLTTTGHNEFTSLQQKTKLKKPLDPPSTKAGPASHNDSHAEKGNLTNKLGHTNPAHSTKQSKKSATVSFSDLAKGEPSEASRQLSDSSDHDLERTTVQRIMTVVVVITERTKIEVYNSKGQLTHQNESSVEVERTTLEPKVTGEKYTNRPITPQLSPSRSVSTVTTGDLADVSSSSLSRTYSSGSKVSNPSIDAVFSSLDLPTPAQRQHSLEGQDKGRQQQECEGQHLSDLSCGSGVLSKRLLKRISVGSNTGQDLFSTPNQSIIDRADSHIGKVISSSSSTPGFQPLISPNAVINKPDNDGQTTTTLQQSKNASTLVSQVATSPGLLSDNVERTPVTTLVSGLSTSVGNNERVTGILGLETLPNNTVYEHKYAETPQRQELSIRKKRSIKSDRKGDNSDEQIESETSSEICSKKKKVLDHDTISLQNDKHKINTSGKTPIDKAKDNVGESADSQSTGFSVLDVPSSTASGDSLKDPGATVSIKSSAGLSISSEISFQGGAVKSHAPLVVLKDYKSKAETGAKVMGKWKDGYYYPGVLSKVDQNNKKYMVRFDDGSQSVVKVNEIILARELPVGQSVMVMTSQDLYEPGMIMGHSERQEEEGAVSLTYHVERDDGVTQICERSSLILSEGQAACLLSDDEMKISHDACTPSTSKPGDVSLDNLVDGKRHPRSTKSSKKEDQTASASLQSTSEAVSVSTVESETCHSGRKRKIGPVATSTPTPKQVCKEGRKKGTPIKKYISSPLGGAVVSPSEPRKRPRKARTGLLFESVSLKNSKLFEGILFMLTHVQKSAEDRDQEKILLNGSSLETSADDNTDVVFSESEMSFVKDQLQTIIERGGGQVITSFDEVVMHSAKQCYLVAAEHQRTVKYLQALAAGMTIISHQWILHSAAQNQLQCLKSYILPAGISLEKKKLIEGTKGCRELARQTAMVVSANQEFVDVWTSILRTAHSDVVSRFPSRASKNDPGVDVVVSDSTCPANIVRRCQQLDVPLVSSEWVAQSLITGRLVDVKGHEKYKHDFSV